MNSDQMTYRPVQRTVFFSDTEVGASILSYVFALGICNI